MAKVNVTADEFANIVVSFLLDKLMHPDEMIPGNELFDEYANKMKLKGMKPVSLQYYLKMDTLFRVYYKRIKGVFYGEKNQAMIIYIYPNKKEKEKAEKKDGLVKRVIKKLLKKESIDKKDYNLLVEHFKDEE